MRTGTLLFVVLFLGCEGEVKLPGLAPPVDPGLVVPPEPCVPGVGHPLPHRLNNEEYRNSVRDVFGLAAAPAVALPLQGRGSFSNNAEALIIDPSTFDALFAASATVVDEAMRVNRAAIVSCAPSQACARQIATTLGRLAFRRPVSAAEATSLVDVYDFASAQQLPFDDAVKVMLRAMLMSTQFLFRSYDPALPAYELAARLSFFLWSSGPDDALLLAAEDGSLSTDAGLKAQVDRMLADGRSRALAGLFFAEWFDLIGGRVNTLDPVAFPRFTPALQASMRRESQLFFEDLVANDTPLESMLTAQYGFVDAELARHYGLAGTFGTTPARVSLTGTGRVGIVGQAAFLSMTSDPTDSNVVRRGLWVMDNVLCSPPPPPPGNVQGVDPGATGKTKRELFTTHRNDPACYGCHIKLDPVGFGLERFDADGSVRTTVGGAPLDDLGQLPDGQTFHGAEELSVLLTADTRYATCFSKKLLTFAIGREPDSGEACIAQQIADGARRPGTTFRELLWQVVQSDAMRRTTW